MRVASSLVPAASRERCAQPPEDLTTALQEGATGEHSTASPSPAAAQGLPCSLVVLQTKTGTSLWEMRRQPGIAKAARGACLCASSCTTLQGSPAAVGGSSSSHWRSSALPCKKGEMPGPGARQQPQGCQAVPAWACHHTSPGHHSVWDEKGAVNLPEFAQVVEEVMAKPGVPAWDFHP